MTHPTPQGLPPQTAEDYLRGRYGAYRGHFAWRELEEAFNGGLRAQAASVEPVGKIINSGGNTGSLPEHPLLVWLGGVPPVGTELYASAPPSPASVQNASLVEKLAKRTCEANADSARFTIALQTLRASLDPDDWMGAVTMHNYIDAVLAGGSPLQQHPAPSPATAVMQVGCENIDGTLNIHPETETCSICEPAQAVGAVDEREAGHVGDTRFEGWLSESVHKSSMYLKQDMRDSYWAGYQERAALQAARQPQAQQVVAEGAGGGLRQTLIDVGRVIAWQCFGDCRAYDEFGPGSLRGLHEMDAEIRAALATKEPK